MFKRQEFPCADALITAADCLCREAVILQNMAEYGDFDERLRHLRGLCAAAHRNWRELNERLGRLLVAPVEREDISLWVRELAEAAALLTDTAVMWQHAPFAGAHKWVTRVAVGCGLVRDLTGQLIQWGEETRLPQLAAELYTLRRESDAGWAAERQRLPAEAAEVSAAFHDCCTALARTADTAEWLMLKNG